MTSAVGSTASNTTNNQAQILSLQKQLTKYEKELTTDETSKNTTAAQLVSTEIALVESQIAQLSKVTNVAATAAVASPANSTKTLGNKVDVKV